MTGLRAVSPSGTKLNMDDANTEFEDIFLSIEELLLLVSDFQGVFYHANITYSQYLQGF